MLSSRSFTGLDTLLLKLRQMFDMLSPVGLPISTYTPISNTHTYTAESDRCGLIFCLKSVGIFVTGKTVIQTATDKVL